jgi:hypothetical protein
MQHEHDGREQHHRSDRHPKEISESWFHRHTVLLEVERTSEWDVPGP